MNELPNIDAIFSPRVRGPHAARGPRVGQPWVKLIRIYQQYNLHAVVYLDSYVTYLFVK
jgi:hypothetical protein